LVNNTKKTLTKNSKQKTPKTDQKTSTADTTAAAERECKLVACKREVGKKKRHIALHSRYVTYIHVPACGSNRRERRCKYTTVEREPPEREREREQSHT
jgi:hypothetical protein